MKIASCLELLIIRRWFFHALVRFYEGAAPAALNLITSDEMIRIWLIKREIIKSCALKKNNHIETYQNYWSLNLVCFVFTVTQVQFRLHSLFSIMNQRLRIRIHLLDCAFQTSEKRVELCWKSHAVSIYGMDVMRWPKWSELRGVSALEGVMSNGLKSWWLWGFSSGELKVQSVLCNKSCPKIPRIWKINRQKKLFPTAIT